MIRKVLIPLALLAVAGSTAYAYELGTHGALTYEAYKRSVLTDSEFLKQLGTVLHRDQPAGDGEVLHPWRTSRLLWERFHRGCLAARGDLCRENRQERHSLRSDQGKRHAADPRHSGPHRETRCGALVLASIN